MRPDLPPEIQDQIFDRAARMHPRYAPTLSVISKRVQSRVEKVIYEKLHFFPVQCYLPWPRSAEVATIELFKPTLTHRPAEFFATHVRSVIFQDNVQYCSGRLVLEKCTGLEHLAFLRHRPFDLPDASPLILPSAYTLQSLMTNRDILNYMANSGIVFPKLRYLWISVCYHTRVPDLQWLPALHTVDLFLHRDPWGDDSWKGDATTVLSTTRHLQVMGLYVFEDCLDIVDRWKETVVSSVRIKTRVRKSFSGFVLERWKKLATCITDVLLEA